MQTHKFGISEFDLPWLHTGKGNETETHSLRSTFNLQFRYENGK